MLLPVLTFSLLFATFTQQTLKATRAVPENLPDKMTPLEQQTPIVLATDASDSSVKVIIKLSSEAKKG